LASVGAPFPLLLRIKRSGEPDQLSRFWRNKATLRVNSLCEHSARDDRNYNLRGRHRLNWVSVIVNVCVVFTPLEFVNVATNVFVP